MNGVEAVGCHVVTGVVRTRPRTRVAAMKVVPLASACAGVLKDVGNRASLVALLDTVQAAVTRTGVAKLLIALSVRFVIVCEAPLTIDTLSAEALVALIATVRASEVTPACASALADTAAATATMNSSRRTWDATPGPR